MLTGTVGNNGNNGKILDWCIFMEYGNSTLTAVISTLTTMVLSPHTYIHTYNSV